MKWLVNVTSDVFHKVWRKDIIAKIPKEGTRLECAQWKGIYVLITFAKRITEIILQRMKKSSKGWPTENKLFFTFDPAAPTPLTYWDHCGKMCGVSTCTSPISRILSTTSTIRKGVLFHRSDLLLLLTFSMLSSLGNVMGFNGRLYHSLNTTTKLRIPANLRTLRGSINLYRSTDFSKCGTKLDVAKHISSTKSAFFIQQKFRVKTIPPQYSRWETSRNQRIGNGHFCFKVWIFHQLIPAPCRGVIWPNATSNKNVFGICTRYPWTCWSQSGEVENDNFIDLYSSLS